MMQSIQKKITKDGICVLTFDRPDSSANIFDMATLSALGAALDTIAEEKPRPKGLIITSAKESIFVAGADLRAVERMSVEEMKSFIALGQMVFSRIAGLPYPTVAAVHGAAVGGGYEICLACDWRVASPASCTKLGLPETKLGIVPAWGGCTRLPRLIGVPRALDIILGGKTPGAKHALKLGMVDEVVPRERLIEAAKAWLKKGKHPHRFSYSAPINAILDTVVAPQARYAMMQQTRGLYPAPQKALDVIIKGATDWNENESLSREREAVAELIGLDSTRNLLRVFFLQERARKLSAPGVSTAASAPPPIRNIAVIGAGVMGAGIAQWLSSRGLSVILRDVDPARVAAGMASVDSLYAASVKKRVFTEQEARAGRDRITPAPVEIPLPRTQFVIEAAVETMDIKKAIFRRLDDLVREDAILATNTSALSITELAAATKFPRRVVGFHFFNPVHQMQLVEVVTGWETPPEIAQRALRFAQGIGKLPVLVKDSPGFLVNRILLPYMIAAGELFWSGAAIEDIDEAMLDFGMPMGPLRLIDEVGADVAAHVATTLAAAFPDRLRVPEILPAMIREGLLGRKAGKGFYLHPKGRDAAPNPAAIALRPSSPPHPLTRRDLARRMSLLMVNEASRCLEERIVEKPADVDFAMVMGTGFAPFRGGPLRLADRVGAQKMADQLSRLADSVGPQYAPSALLQKLAEKENDFMKTETAPQDEEKSVIDTSKMSREQREALELTEAAREAASETAGFASGLFMGRFPLGSLHPYPLQRAEDRDQGDAFLQRLEKFLKEHVDPDEIDRTGEIPQEVFDGLAQLGAFGVKIPVEYEGLGLSQTNYCRAAMMLGSSCGNLTALLSAHQSIGVPQPLILFGTEEQKRRFLPRVAKGEVSAFALTEPNVGSDPAKMETRAEPTPDGQHFVINGEKLWCTNVVKAGVIVVMAKTPPKNGRNQITAFIVNMDTPGVEVVRRCHFMGLRALYNGVIRFTDVKVPRENILAAEGKGLRVALTTLNTGRLTLPAACVGLSKRCLEIVRKWAGERVQWGAAIGKHAAIAEKISRIASETFAMEAMTLYAASIVDRDKHADVRLEAAMCKLWGTERSWEHIDAAMQIRGGRGYETAASLAARGESPVPVERLFRDSRINAIFEGSSEIMRLFIAREALDPHLKIGAPMLNTRLPMKERAQAAAKAGLFYAGWYPRQWFAPISNLGLPITDFDSRLGSHLRWAATAAHRLGRALFHAMARYGPKLEREQVLLGRFVDISTEIFAIAAACARAQALRDPSAIDLADVFGQNARLKIERLFDGIHHNADRPGYKLAQRVLSGEYSWLEAGALHKE